MRRIDCLAGCLFVRHGSPRRESQTLGTTKQHLGTHRDSTSTGAKKNSTIRAAWVVQRSPSESFALRFIVVEQDKPPLSAVRSTRTLQVRLNLGDDGDQVCSAVFGGEADLRALETGHTVIRVDRVANDEWFPQPYDLKKLTPQMTVCGHRNHRTISMAGWRDARRTLTTYNTTGGTADTLTATLTSSNPFGFDKEVRFQPPLRETSRLKLFVWCSFGVTRHVPSMVWRDWSDWSDHGESSCRWRYSCRSRYHVCAGCGYWKTGRKPRGWCECGTCWT